MNQGAPEGYARQVEQVFARSWLPLPIVAGEVQRGCARPFKLLPGCLDEPLVAVRDGQDQLRLLSNACTHRGNLIVRESGPAHSLRCAYHGRVFDPSGCLTAAPGFEDVEGFPCAADHLPSLALETWGPLLFASLLDAPGTLDELLAALRERTDWLEPERFVLDPTLSRDYLVEAHWALYCDNFLEGFHIPYVHPGLARALDCSDYDTQVQPWSSVQIGIARDHEDSFSLPAQHPDAGRSVAAWYFWLWPNTMLNFYPWGLSLNMVLPEGPRRTRVAFRTFLRPGNHPRTGAGLDLHQVELEDEEVVEACQVGVLSRLYHPGCLAPSREPAVQHFHELLERALREA